MLNIVLFEPEIPPNTGNIIRLAANTGCMLHLIAPLGFSLAAKDFKRAALDYTERAQFTVHPNFTAFSQNVVRERIFLCSTKATTNYSTVKFQANDVLVFGPETRGLPTQMLAEFAEQQKITIPMRASGRSLNLATAVAIVVYEAWRQLEFR